MIQFETVLPSPALNNAAANSVYVSDGSVYVAGYYNNGLVDVATVWKDGVKLYDLPTASTGQNARANSISIYNGTVYVAGYYDDGIAKLATLWQDGVRIDLSSVPGLNAEAKIHLSIYRFKNWKKLYWKKALLCDC
jgi:streptogramin lyase